MEKCQAISLAYNSYEPVHGTEQETPIIFLHGVTACKENWRDIPQIVANATGRKAYSLDSRNHGDSEWTEAFDFQVNVDDLLLFMDTNHIKKAIIVGHSMGGITAIKTALRSPEKVEKLIVEDMTAKSPSQTLLSNTLLFLELTLAALKPLPTNLSLVEAKQFIVDFIYSHVPQEFKPYVARRCNEPALNLKQIPGGYTYKTNFSLLLKKLKNADSLLVPNEGIYEGPALFIYGEKSPFNVGQDEDNVKRLFPNAEMVDIKEAEHNVHEDFPLRFTEAILAFLQGGWNRKS